MVTAYHLINKHNKVLFINEKNKNKNKLSVRQKIMIFQYKTFHVNRSPLGLDDISCGIRQVFSVSHSKIFSVLEMRKVKCTEPAKCVT